MNWIFWLCLTVAFIVIEASTVGLVSVWFAAGSFVTMLVSFFCETLWVQIVVFLAVSVVALLATRPLVKKWKAKTGDGKTNFDRIIGMTGVTEETIDNLAQTGYVSVDGKDWMARSENGETIEKGALVNILRIDGAKVFVERK